jgi:predicted nucleic acid-binding protein
MKIVITQNASKRFVIDSSGWIEYLGNGPKAKTFAPYFEKIERVLLPSIVVFEVYKKLLRTTGKDVADQFLFQAFSFGDREIPLDAQVAALAAQISLDMKLALADAIIYASASFNHAELISSDAHFTGLPNVTIL